MSRHKQTLKYSPSSKQYQPIKRFTTNSNTCWKKNLVLDASGYIKLVDFGLAKRIASTNSFTMCGTIEYLSPECITGAPLALLVTNKRGFKPLKVCGIKGGETILIKFLLVQSLSHLSFVSLNSLSLSIALVSSLSHAHTHSGERVERNARQMFYSQAKGTTSLWTSGLSAFSSSNFSSDAPPSRHRCSRLPFPNLCSLKILNPLRPF